MLKYVGRRVAEAGITLIVIALASFLLIRASPGSPLSSEKALSTEARAVLVARYELDRPLMTQFFRYLWELGHGNLGTSFKYPGREVNTLIRDALPATLWLGALALGGAISLGLLAGLLTAGAPGHALSQTLFALSGVLLGTPSFVLGPLLMLLVSLHLGLLPAAGWGETRHLVLPALTLGAGYWAQITRLCRAGVLGALQEDYMRFARAKGLPLVYRLRTHALWAGLRPVIVFLGPAAASVLAGSVVVEKLFCVPGMGPFFVDAALNRDYPLVMGIVLVASVFLLLFQIATDILLALVDPRVRLD